MRRLRAGRTEQGKHPPLASRADDERRGCQQDDLEQRERRDQDDERLRAAAHRDGELGGRRRIVHHPTGQGEQPGPVQLADLGPAEPSGDPRKPERRRLGGQRAGQADGIRAAALVPEQPHDSNDVVRRAGDRQRRADPVPAGGHPCRHGNLAAGPRQPARHDRVEAAGQRITQIQRAGRDPQLPDSCRDGRDALGHRDEPAAGREPGEHVPRRTAKGAAWRTAGAGGLQGRILVDRAGLT